MKNWKQFLKEPTEEEVEKQIKINDLERELFRDIIERLINSNNVDKMKEYIDFMDGKLWLSINQFVHKRIYELENKNIDKEDVEIDYDDLSKRIESFKKRVDSF